jgi:hypothetical protein
MVGLGALVLAVGLRGHETAALVPAAAKPTR